MPRRAFEMSAIAFCARTLLPAGVVERREMTAMPNLPGDRRWPAAHAALAGKAGGGRTTSIEVVKARHAVHADLGYHARQRRPSIEISQHTALELAGADEPLFDNDLGVIRLRDLDGLFDLSGIVHLGDTQA